MVAIIDGPRQVNLLVRTGGRTTFRHSSTLFDTPEPTMCTLIVTRGVEIDSPAHDRAALMVGANRDEALDRPADPPAVMERAGVRILAPRDQRAGGTWLGLNEFGVFCGLTNRYGASFDPDRRSRGELVFEALTAKDAEAAAGRISELDGADYNGFHLICADPDEMHLVWGGPAPIVCRAVGSQVAVVTERSLGAARDARKRRTKKRVHQAIEDAEFGADWLKSILSESDSGSFEDLCICLEDVNYGTRSSTLLEIGAESRGWHSEGPPCSTAYEDISGLVADVLEG